MTDQQAVRTARPRGLLVPRATGYSLTAPHDIQFPQLAGITPGHDKLTCSGDVAADSDRFCPGEEGSAVRPRRPAGTAAGRLAGNETGFLTGFLYIM